MQPGIWTLRCGHEATRFDCAPLEAAPAFLGLLYLLSTLYCTYRRQYYCNYYRKLSHLGLRLGVCDETDMQTQLDNQRLARHADFNLPSRQLQAIAHGGVAQGGIVLQRDKDGFNVRVRH